MMMDIDQIARIVTDNSNETAKTISYNKTRGPVHSANEHLVPEMLFDNPDTAEKEAEGVSAVKALQVAAQQGQKIFTITQANSATALPLISHKAVIMQDVRDALAAGKTVTISERSVTVANWTGTGYIITDPTTGAGSYLIGGGADGAAIAGNIVKGVGLVLVVSGLFGVTVAPFLLLLFTIVTVAVVFMNALASAEALLDKGCSKLADFAFVTSLLLGLLAIILPPVLNKFFGGKSGVEKILLSLIASMYGAKFFTGLAGGVEC